MVTNQQSSLALYGGHPISTTRWPRWPTIGEWGRELLADVADSGVWAVSGRSTGSRLQCQMFRDEFAAYNRRGWCVETDHGTSALITAYDAMGIGAGDEVIVPVLTWVACATSVLQVGASPVLVDVDPETLCLDPEQVRRSVTTRTKAILVVHLHCTAADMDALREISTSLGVPLIEDCAQAHGAVWSDGRPVGSDGVLSTFSMQQGKPLSAGEGGAVVGDDALLRRRAESARADGRRLVDDVPEAGQMFLEESVDVIGANYCLNEWSAAVLRDGLSRLESETAHRSANADLLDALLAERGLATIKRNPDLAVRAVYEYGILLPPATAAAIDMDEFRRAVSAELGSEVYGSDPPLHLSALYATASKKRFAELTPARPASDFPVATAAIARMSVVHHSMLLAPATRMPEIADAFVKVLSELGRGTS